MKFHYKEFVKVFLLIGLYKAKFDVICMMVGWWWLRVVHSLFISMLADSGFFSSPLTLIGGLNPEPEFSSSLVLSNR